VPKLLTHIPQHETHVEQDVKKIEDTLFIDLIKCYGLIKNISSDKC